MLGYARAGSAIWEDEDFGSAADDDFVPALAHAFERQASRALAGGALRGYVTRDDALPLVRGRWRLFDQLTRRSEQPLPVEVSFDDYLEDTPENQLVLTAATPVTPAAGNTGRCRRLIAAGSAGARRCAGHPGRRTGARGPAGSAECAVLGGAAAGVARVGRRVDRAAGRVTRRRRAPRRHVVGVRGLRDGCALEGVSALREALVAQYASTLDVDGRMKNTPDLGWRVDGEVRACTA